MENNGQKKTKLPGIFIFLMIVGPMLLLTGLSLVIVGAATGAIIPFLPIGMVVLFIGIVGCAFGFLPLIQRTGIRANRYVMEKNKDDLTAIADTGADVTKGAVKTISKSAASGIKEGIEEGKKFCKHCGAEIDADSVFCSKCGGKQ